MAKASVSACPAQEGMSFIGHSGKVTGYNYDYLEKISEHTGWEMDYVAYPSNDGNESVGSAISDLIAGKVDLMGPLLKNEQAEQLFEFPENSYGTVYTTLCAPESSDLREYNLITQPLVRVGLWEQASVRNSEALTFLNSEKLSYEIVYFSSAAEQKQALYDGQVDVISSVSLSPVANTRIVAQFALRPYYFVSTKGNTNLIAELDAAIEKVNHTEPKLRDSLYDTYFRTSDDAFLPTDAQRESLHGMGTLRVLCFDSDAPYVYRQQDGEPTGMIVSILERFAQEVGLTLDYTFCAELGFVNSAPIISSPLAYVQRPASTIAVMSPDRHEQL